MVNELNQTKNNFCAVGMLVEKALEYKQNDKTKIGKGDDRHDVVCESITGKFTVDIGDGVVTFFSYFYSVGYDGNEAKNWKSAKALYDANPKIGGKAESSPAKVRVTGQLNFYDGYNEEKKEVTSRLGYRVSFVSCSVDEDADVGMTIETDAFVRKVTEEVKDDEPTGRYKIELLGVDYNGAVYPIECIADEEAVPYIIDGNDGFEPFEARQTRTGLVIEYHIRHKGGASPTGRRTFGRKNNVETISGGKSEVELMLVGGDYFVTEAPEDEEEETKYLDPETIKKAIKAREQHLEEIKNNPTPAPEKKKEETKKSTKRQTVAADDDEF